MRKLNKKVRVGKERWKEKGEVWRIREAGGAFVPSQVFGEHGSVPEVESARTPFGTSWCVLDVLLSVLVVTVLLSCVNGDCVSFLFASDC